MPFEPTDFTVGLDIGICGRAIRIYDADTYSREFFIVSTFFVLFVTHIIYIELWSTTS